MHFRLLLTFDKKLAETSQEARDYVLNELENDSSFVGEGGRFGNPVADWFVIGGRWSGELSNKTWAKKVIKEIELMEKKENLQIAGCWYGNKKETKKQAEVRAIAEKMYQDAMPKKLKNKNLVYDRFINEETYNQNGFYDDAMIVNKTLYDAFLKEYKGKEKGKTHNVSIVKGMEDYSWDDLHFVDLDDEPVDKEFIGNKWIVVVDYHT